MEVGDWALFAAVGAAAGFFAGLLGTGGGAIMTPLLIIFLEDALPPEHLPQAAAASSMAVIVLNSLPSVFTHARRGAVDWRLGGWMAAGAAGGALLSSGAAQWIPAPALIIALALFFLHIARQMFFPPPVREGNKKISPRTAATAGTLIGAVSALFGIGGGSMSVPFLSGRGVAVKRAIGTSAFVGSPLAMFAVAGYALGGGGAAMPPWSVGYVYLPAVAAVAIFSMLFAALGARATAKLSDQLLRRIFGAVVALLSLRLLVGALF